MKILFLSFFYAPDLSAGSFRAEGLAQALLKQLPEGAHIDLMSTMPNRYSSFKSESAAMEVNGALTIYRFKIPSHSGGMFSQAKSYFFYAIQVLKAVRTKDYDLIIVTSGRLMSSVLGSLISRIKGVPLYLDIRDIFADTIKDVLPSFAARTGFVVFSVLEKFAVQRAVKVNLVSKGFEPYFKKRYPQKSFSFFTNGIDKEFMNLNHQITDSSLPSKKIKTILYAGNFGDGQGLHLIIPQLAKSLETSVIFRVIGDGGKKNLLISKLAELGCKNVEILPPVKRAELVKEYQEADVLFLHLNDYDAFTKVLPSKVFEYASMGKPIWGGLAGYAAHFVKTEISNAALFTPCNPEDGLRSFAELKFELTDRSEFMEKHSRINIMNKLSKDILSLGKV